MSVQGQTMENIQGQPSERERELLDRIAELESEAYQARRLRELVDEQATRIAELEAQQEEYEYNASCIMATKDKRIAELKAQIEAVKKDVCRWHDHFIDAPKAMHYISQTLKVQ